MDYDKMNYLQQDALAKLRKAAINASAVQKIALRDFEKAQVELDKWTKRYELALQESNQASASQAKYQKERYQAIADRLKNLIEEQQPQLDRIKGKLGSWKKRLSEEQNTVLLPEFNTNTFSGFNRIEKKLLESQTNAEEVSQSHNTIDESELINFESFESMDDELTRLKGDLLNKSQDCQDFGKILNEAIEQTKETLQITVSNQKGTQKQYEQAQKEAKEWHNKTQIALQNDDDNQALNALISKTVQKKWANGIENQLKQQQATLTLIKNNLSVLEKVKRMFEVEIELLQMKTQIISSRAFQENYLQTADSPLDKTVDAEVELLRKELDEM